MTICCGTPRLRDSCVYGPPFVYSPFAFFCCFGTTPILVRAACSVVVMRHATHGD